MESYDSHAFYQPQVVRTTDQPKEHNVNRQQARHAKAMARKIKTHAEGITLRMASIEREVLEDVPLGTVTTFFTHELEGYIRGMRAVVTDMLDELADQ